jgi:pimeloyl-ACP methyl ester carboxylesterase
MVYYVLIMEIMTRLTLKLIGTAFDLLLATIPNSCNVSNLNQNSLKKQSSKSAPNGWIYKEITSPFSGYTHRYLYHPSKKNNAPPFLFLHGLFFDARNFLNLYKLSDTWQLIAYDFPESTTIYRGDMNDFRFLIDDFLDTLKIDTLYLCGVSFGGSIAIRFSAAHPRRIKTLVLASSFIINSTPSDRIKSREIARFLLKHPDYKLHWLIQKILMLVLNGRNNPLSSLKEMIQVKNIDWYRQVIRSITTCEGTEDAVRISCPVLALNGDKDRLVSLNHARSIPRYINHTHFDIIKGANHAMMYLQGEYLSEKIYSFCSKFL